MPEQNVLLPAFNSGVLSPLMWGRVDFRRYGFALKYGRNFLAAPQGPVLSAPGTQRIASAQDETRKSWLTPWIFAEQQLLVLEWSHEKLRFFSNDGIKIEAVKATSAAVSSAGTTLTITSTAHGYSTGDAIFLNGFIASVNLNGRVIRCTVLDPNTIEFAIPGIAAVLGDVSAVTVARVYEVTTPYQEADLPALRLVRQLNDTYVYCGSKAGDTYGYQPRLLRRRGDLDWTIEAAGFIDGPFLGPEPEAAQLTPDATGSDVPTMTANNAPAGNLCSGSSETNPDNMFFKAFDRDAATYWQPTTNQTGTLQIQLASGFVCKGYAIYAVQSSEDTSYLPVDFAPGTWDFDGSNDGVTWEPLDRQVDFQAYEKNRTPYIEIPNETSYSYYRLVVKACTRNGAIKPRVAFLNLGKESGSVQLTASSTTGINNGDGFKATDVGRQIRLRGSDLNWRPARITARSSATVVTVSLTAEPLFDTSDLFEFRMGLLSDTTGWPATAFRYKSRQGLGGIRDFPSFLALSQSGGLNIFSPTDFDGVVTDENGFVLELDSPELADIRWFTPFDKNRGIVVGTGSGLFILTQSDTTKPFAGTNLDQDPIASDWTSRVEPVLVEQALLHVASDRRRLMEMTFEFVNDGFAGRNVTLYAQHLTSRHTIEQVAHVRQPYPLVLMRRSDGVLVMLSYNRTEDVLGATTYEPGEGSAIESMAVLPDANSDQHLIWLTVRRQIGGVTRRFVERLYPFWREGFTVADTAFVQAGARYSGTPISTVYGLQDYEGAEIVGLADGIPITPQTVIGGSITLPEASGDIVLGLPFDAFGETVSLEGGAAQGTAQGQSKRAHRYRALVFDSQTGQLGKLQDGAYAWEDIVYRTANTPFGQIEPPVTRWVDVDALAGHDLEATVAFRRDGALPLPFHVASLVPALETRG